MKILSTLLILFLSAISISAFGQDEIDNLIKGSTADANYLVKGYVTPALNTISAGLNQGWYNTAKSHKKFGFDLTVTVSGVYIPSSDLTYRVENSQMTNVSVTPNSATAIDAPTIFGSETSPVYRERSTGATFEGAPGIDLKGNIGYNFVPVPMYHLGIGLPKGTDLKLRFIPNISVGDNGSISMFGIGIMHDIKQYIPGIKELPFDLSGFVGYTQLKSDVGLDDTRPDQKVEYSTSATTIQGLISKKISVLTFYGGLGYNFTKANFDVKGTYTVNNSSAKDPVSISASQSGPRLTAGMRLKLAIFTFHGDYTLQKYNSFTLGFGFSVR